MYSVFGVANWFLRKEPMIQKKLQKLCYYTQAWSYALKGIAFMDDEFEAWVHGPVSPKLYGKYGATGFIDLYPDNPNEDFNFTAEHEEHLESIWETYGDCTGNGLEALSHTEPPWINARRGHDSEARCNAKISPDDMRSYYRSIYEGDLALEA